MDEDDSLSDEELHHNRNIMRSEHYVEEQKEHEWHVEVRLTIERIGRAMREVYPSVNNGYSQDKLRNAINELNRLQSKLGV